MLLVNVSIDLINAFLKSVKGNKQFLGAFSCSDQGHTARRLRGQEIIQKWFDLVKRQSLKEYNNPQDLLSVVVKLCGVKTNKQFTLGKKQLKL